MHTPACEYFDLPKHVVSSAFASFYLVLPRLLVHLHASSFLEVCILGIFAQLCLYFSSLTFPLLATPVRLTDLTPAGKTAVALSDQDTPSSAPAAPRAHGQSFLGAALSFSTVELFTFTMHRLSSGLHQLLIMGW